VNTKLRNFLNLLKKNKLQLDRVKAKVELLEVVEEVSMIFYLVKISLN